MSELLLEEVRTLFDAERAIQKAAEIGDKPGILEACEKIRNVCLRFEFFADVFEDREKMKDLELQRINKELDYWREWRYKEFLKELEAP